MTQPRKRATDGEDEENGEAEDDGDEEDEAGGGGVLSVHSARSFISPLEASMPIPNLMRPLPASSRGSRVARNTFAAVNTVRQSPR
jgi:hypothetical protein